jgi:hypothetical protein
MSGSPPIADSDFLAHMVDKAIGSDVAIEPRLPSLFEPPQGAILYAGTGWPHEPARVADREGERGRSTVGPAAIADPALLPTKDKRDGAPAWRDPESGHHAWSPAAPGSDSESSGSLRPAFLAPLPAARESTLVTARTVRGAPAGQTAETRRTPATQELRPLSDGDEVTVLRSSAADRDGPSSPPSLRAGRAPAARSKEPDETHVRDADRAERATLAPDPRAIRPVIVVAPPAVPRRSARDEARSEQTNAHPVPVVNVTIGRIEVRAVQSLGAATRPRPEKRGSQPMSLDEYLKRRGGGR